MMPARLTLLLLALLVVPLGCAGHAARTEGARSALDAGAPEKALERLNDELDVDSAKALPDDLSGDNTVLILDRAMVLQSLASLGKPNWRTLSELSSRDLEAADKQIEILDLSRGAIDDIGKYMFSDSSGPYKAPTYEKLMLNTVNMMNYLSRGDLNGARVEARRLAVMQKFIKEHENIGADLTGPGSYLAGFIFEKSERPQEALRFYDEALQHGDFESLHPVVARLARKASYRSPRINAILKERKGSSVGDDLQSSPSAEESSEGQRQGGTTESESEGETGESEGETGESEGETGESEGETGESEGKSVREIPPTEVLVVINYGRVPAKKAKRVPIGLALTWVSGALSPTDRAKANYLAGQGLVTWVNYPELGRPRGEYSTPGFALGGKWQRLEGALAVDRQARQAWEKAKGAVVASAITRMITRVVAGETTRRATGGGLMGALLSLGTQAALTAADTPDTRSWATLPARIAMGRVDVQPGTHYVDLEARGVRKRQKLKLGPGDWAVVVLTVLH